MSTSNIAINFENPITVKFDVTWYKGQANEVTKTVERTFDLSQVTAGGIIEYALRPLVILEQAKLRNKLPSDAVLSATIVASEPGTRMVSKEKFEIISFLTAQGVSPAQAQMLAKMRGKDQGLKDFVTGLQDVLKGFGMEIDLLSKLPADAE